MTGLSPGGWGDAMHGDAEQRWWSRGAWAFLELFALSGLAIGQPLFDVLAKNSELFVTRRTTGVQTLALVAVVLLVPPVVAFGIEVAVGTLGGTARRWAHGVLAGAFGAVFVVEAVKHQSSLGTTALMGVGVSGGIVVGLLVTRSALTRQLLHFLAIAPAVFAAWFLAFSPVTGVVFGGEDPAAAATHVGVPRRVVLVVLDELPVQSLLDGTGHVDGDLFPSFAAFAADATWYRNHSSVAAFTRGAVPAILSGRYPADESALPITSEYRQNLFTVLGDSYQMNVHEVATRLCPQALCDPGTTGFGGLVRRSTQLWGEFASPSRTRPSFDDADALADAAQTAKAFERSLEPGGPMRLDFVHIELPHYPWRYISSLQDYGLDEDPPGESFTVWPTVPGVATARQRHLLQLQATDMLLGRIVDRLRDVGAYDDALVIVTADHGVAFTTGEPARNPSQANLSQIMWTPLFVKYPGQSTGSVDDRPTESVDVLPTVADVLDVDLPARVDGRSLLGAPRAEGTRRLYPWIWLQTAKDLHPPAGRAYVEVAGASGFAAAIKGRAAVPGGDPSLRIYRRGLFGALIGGPTAPLVRDRDGVELASIDNTSRFADLDPSASSVPWVWNVGTLRGVPAGVPVAVSVNGTVAAVSETLAPEGDTVQFTFLLPPSLVREGRNELGVYLVRGTPTNPTLDPVTLAS